MKLQDAYYIIDTLKEGIAEVAGQKCFNIKELKEFLEREKIVLSNQKQKNDFLEQYPTFEIFSNRTFDMYNRKLQTGYIVNNTNHNFEKDLKPILKDFYSSL